MYEHEGETRQVVAAAGRHPGRLGAGLAERRRLRSVLRRRPFARRAAPLAAAGTSEAGGAGGGCSGALAADYAACHQEHYDALVSDSGVKAAFAELKDEYEENGFV